MAAPPTVRGTVRLYVAPVNALDDESARALLEVVENFVEALRLSMFRGKLVRIHGVSQADDGAVEARFDVLDVEPGAFRVLLGMLSHFSMIVAPLGAMTAWQEPQGSSPNLLTAHAPMPALPARVPFSVNLSTRGGAAPPLVVEVVLGKALSPDDKNRLARELLVWTAVVNGGYPGGNDPPGTSAIGPLSVRFDDAQTLRLSADAFMAGPECFVALQALLLGWSNTIPVNSLETE